MRRREAPGRIVDPGPAPGRDPLPVAVAIGRPVGDGDAGIPDRAMAGVLAGSGIWTDVANALGDAFTTLINNVKDASG